MKPRFAIEINKTLILFSTREQARDFKRQYLDPKSLKILRLTGTVVS